MLLLIVSAGVRNKPESCKIISAETFIQMKQIFKKMQDHQCAETFIQMKKIYRNL